MKLIGTLSSAKPYPREVVATIGNFDGVHLGHEHLLKALVCEAKLMKLPSLVILFEPQPKEFFTPQDAPARLSTLREKLTRIKHYEIDFVYCIKFSTRVALTSAEEFVARYLVHFFSVRHLFVGSDFKFGRGRVGDGLLLQRLGAHHRFQVSIQPDFFSNQVKVSSTRIRALLHQGALTAAAHLLGYSYRMSGRVVRGEGRGRQWGIPTLNIHRCHRTLSLQGVFVVKVLIGGRYEYGVANIGCRPTVDGHKNILEVHLFDFNQNVYGVMAQVIFLHHLRPEIKFSNLDALLQQIRGDIAAAKTFLTHSAHDFVE